jgi:hypothetical protein
MRGCVVSEPGLKLWEREIFIGPAGNKTPAFQPVARRCTEEAIPTLDRQRLEKEK